MKITISVESFAGQPSTMGVSISMPVIGGQYGDYHSLLKGDTLWEDGIEVWGVTANQAMSLAIKMILLRANRLIVDAMPEHFDLSESWPK